MIRAGLFDELRHVLDIDHYLRLVEPLDDSDIGYEAFFTDPFDDDTL